MNNNSTCTKTRFIVWKTALSVSHSHGLDQSSEEKRKAPVEFGAKFHLSIDDSGLGRIERISYDAYNESTVLVEAVERFRERTGYYPERLLADQIYRTRDNRNFCKLHGIRLSGPKLGRPSLTKQSSKEKKQEYQDNTDRNYAHIRPAS